MVGCSLSSAGAAFQGIFQNPLVSPDFLGASQGAAFGACLAILYGASSLAISVTAFAFSMLSVAAVLLVSKFSRGNCILVTVLAGVMVSSLFNAGAYTICSGWKTASNSSAVRKPSSTQASRRLVSSAKAFFATFAAFS